MGPKRPEHVFPQWFSKIVGGQGRFLIEHSSGERRSYHSKLIEATTRTPCKGCNEGWMSDLESLVRPLIYGPITNTGVDPDAFKGKNRKTLAVWAVKTGIMLDRYFRTKHVADHHARWLYENRKPPPNCYVWLGAFGFQPGKEQWRPAWGQSTKLLLDRPGKRVNGYAVTWNLGYISFQVAGILTNEKGFDAYERADLRTPDGRVIPAKYFTRGLWPTGKPCDWPPEVAIDHAGLVVWATQAPFFS